MALIKDITLENAIVLSYHRIASINKITNEVILVEICSYINRSERERYDILASNSEHITVYMNQTRLQMQYNEDATITDIYNYIKENVEPFIGAEDDI